MISALEATRQAKSARMSELTTASAERGETMSAEEKDEFDDLEMEVKEIDESLKRYHSAETAQAHTAQPVTKAGDPPAPRTIMPIKPTHIEVKSNLPKGTAFTRYAMALLAAKGNLMHAHEISKRKEWKDTPEVEIILKAAVEAGTTTDNTWAAPLVQYQTVASEFVDLLRPATIIGRIAGLRRVPFNISMPRQTAGSAVNWVGEAKPKPVSELAFDTVTLRWAKAAGIVVLTEELVRFSNPSAEAVVRQDLIDTMTLFLDQQFVDPDVAEVSNVSPASITNAATPIPASGTDADAFRADMRALRENMRAANLSPTGSVIIMRGDVADGLSEIQNPLGQAEFPNLSADGGSYKGMPVLVSDAVPVDTDGSLVILAKASEIMLADDGGVALDASREASVQMNSTPDATSDASTVMISLWQRNMVALRAERWINWKLRRAEAVQYISGANYGASGS